MNNLVIPKKSTLTKIKDIGFMLLNLNILSYQYRPRYKSVDITFRFKV